ncbi:isochorismate lyase [Myxosarcina sp. GI1]|uniref:isochorismate lyase n=1 Tax=Myxosarcina sp. GI1 TaxID=1541065 RepID=UPI00055A2A27|nr:isochorismate lyase [Myxosarcina sp. GI1]
MKPAEKCQNITEVRSEIDRIDRQVIAILAKRFEYVKAAAKFKNSTTDVRAADRLEAMLQQRRVWAESEGLDPDVVEDLYRNLVNYFIDEELHKWRNQ